MKNDELKVVESLNASLERHQSARVNIGMGAYGLILALVCYVLPPRGALACAAGSAVLLLWGIYDVIMAKFDINSTLEK